MIARIQVASNIVDSRAFVLKKRLQTLEISGSIEDLKIIDVYSIEKKLSQKQLQQIAQMLSNPVTQKFSVIASEATPKAGEASQSRLNSEIKITTSPTAPRNDVSFNWTIEYGFLPGVTDNVANTAKESIEDLLKIKFEKEEGVYSSQLILIKGKLSKKDIDVFCESLINPLIQRIHINDSSFYVPKVHLETGEQEKEVIAVNLNVEDEELINIGKFGIQNLDGTRRGPLALNLEYMKTIRDYFKKLKRNPTDIELESIAQTWSEHCKHTIFADEIDEIKDGLFKHYIKRATEIIRKKKSAKGRFCVSVFTDNSGAIEFDNKYLITHKVETHNSPSALDPFGGSITGIVGVNRDAIGFGMGAKPIVNTYGFMLADPNDKKPLFKDASLKQRMLSPRRIMDGVVNGVNTGGNTSGIPTPQGFVYFDQSYKGKPLVFVGTVGLIPKKIAGRPSWKKAARPGDLIVVAGGRVGLDGIHGATFSSVVLDSGSPATAVQIGDPITQKKLSDAIVKEARDLGLYSSITDNGAGGISCSVAEMAKESGGAEVELEKVPTKYPGLKPWQIWISESQERMTLAVPKNKWKKFESLMKKRGVEATVIGKFANNGKCRVLYKNEKIMDLDMKFLHDGLPKRKLVSQEVKLEKLDIKLENSKNPTKDLLNILSYPSIASFEYISSQYDHEVQSSSVLKPLQGKGRINADTSIIKPVLTSSKGIVLSQGFYPRYSEIDTYKMAAASIDTSVRNVIVAGADPEKVAILDNFCWCSSNDPQRLWQLKQACKACFEISTQYGTPFISGKDSMFNDFSGFDETGKSTKISVLPTLLISSLGLIDDVRKSVSIDPKSAGDFVYIMGETFDELGGSEYLNNKDKGSSRQARTANIYTERSRSTCSELSRTILRPNIVSGEAPLVNTKLNKKVYKSYFKAVQKGIISSGIGVGIGGLAVVLSKMAMSSLMGIEVNLKKLPGKVSSDDFAMYSESQGRIVVTVSPKNQKNFEKIFSNIPFAKIGEVTNNKEFIIKGIKGEDFIKTDINLMMKSYKGTFKDY